MKHRALVLLLTFCLLLGVLAPGLPAAAENAPVLSGECGAEGDNMLWSFDPETGTLAFTGSGAMADYSELEDRPWNGLAGQVLAVTLPEGLTRIGDIAFAYFENLSDSLTTLGSGASVGAGLTSVDIPATVQSIGVGAFFHCTSLERVSFHEGLETIGAFAFGCNTALEAVTLPDSLTELGTYAFEEDAALKTFHFGAGLGAIPRGTFLRCGLTELEIPGNVRTIGYGAFYGCVDLARLTLSEGIEALDSASFYLTGLSTVTIPASVTSVGDSSFGRCMSLTEIRVAEGNQNYRAMDGVLFSKDGTLLVQRPAGIPDERYAVPDGVTEILMNAMECGAFSELTFPNSLQIIGEDALTDCPNLLSVTIPVSVIQIDGYALGYHADLDAKERFPVEGFTICGYPGTVAETYAEENGFAFVPKQLSGECGAEGDNLLWSFDPLTGTLTITGSGAMADYEASYDRPWHDYANQILRVELPDGLTHLGMAAFIRCENLTELTLPEGLISIGDQALTRTGAIEELRIPDSVVEVSAPLFRSGVKKLIVGKGLRELSPYFCAECPNLTEVTLSEGTERIGRAAFSQCPALRTVRLPDGLTEIGVYAFNGCSALEEIMLPDSVTEIGDCAFQSCYALAELRLPGKLQKIGPYAFASSGLKTLELPDSATEIGAASFLGCYELAEIRFGAGLTDIADWAFAGARVTELTFPSNIQRIGECAFYSCTQLERVTLPENLRRLDTGAFYACTQLAQAALPERLESIGDGAFSYTKLQTVTIPASVSELGEGPFGGCTALTAIAVAEANQSYVSVDGIVLTADKKTLVQYPAGKVCETYTVPDGIETIAPNALENARFSEVVFPKSLKMIGEFAFADCANLSAVTIHAGVTEIGQCALGYSVDLEAGTVPPMEGFTISGYPGSAAEAYAVENGFAFIKLPQDTGKPYEYAGESSDSDELPQVTENPFEDVAADSYSYDAVLWAVANGITAGTDETHFSPNAGATRAQVVTFLWRAAGSPEPTATECKFTDVKAGSYYEKAVLWAAETGVTTGTSETTFSPDETCTRAQVVTFLWRAAGSPAPAATECKFADVKAGSYYEKAVLWAAETGVTAGTGEASFSPEQSCTRAQIVTFLFITR